MKKNEKMIYVIYMYRIPMSIGVLSQLIAIAYATDRILVLPAMIEMQKWTHAWEYLDTALLNKLVSWRPATFFDHLEARYVKLKHGI
jgi:hypothetical protein